MAMEVQELFDIVERTMHTKIGERNTLRKKLKETNDNLSKVEENVQNYEKASLFLQTLSDNTRQQVIDRISNIVTDALQRIKDPNLEFKMILSTERNQMDLKFVVRDKSTEQEYDIINSCGGSIADIVTFPLKFSLLVKWDPPLSKIIILDENFKFVSVKDQEPLGEFVRQISEKLNMQTILVTHSPTLTSKAHKIFEITQTNGESKAEVKPS